MFLDSRLRALADEKKRLCARAALERRSLALEWGMARADAARGLARLRGGFGIAARLLGLLRRR